MDVPSENPRVDCVPAARSAEGVPPGWPFFWLLFFGHTKKSDSRVSAKALTGYSGDIFSPLAVPQGPHEEQKNTGPTCCLNSARSP